MSQNAKISGLTDELIRSIIGFDAAANRQAYRHAKDIASRGLRGHQYARTNQFDVASSFAGLDEKFRVKSRDDLADALQTRLQGLEGLAGKFKPEYLYLLLQLSDRPLENTRVEALELLRPPSPPPSLTWEEILEDDPYSDEDIWKDIDYAVESSGDERTPKKRARRSFSPPTTIEKDDTNDPEACVTSVEADLVQNLKAAQFWSANVEDDGEIAITELQAVRETLFMLAGLKTSLYHIDAQHGNIRVNMRFVLNHAMPDTLQHLLSELIIIGKDIYRLRQWMKRTSTIPLVQTFEAAVRARIAAYDRALAQLQQQYLTPKPTIAVSLLKLHADVRVLSSPLCRLAQLVSVMEAELLVNPFRHLEVLFEQTTLAQMTLELKIFQYLSSVFFDCLQTYLKPIRKWMEEGELGANDETFFVFQSDSGSDVSSLWHDRYALRRDAHNNLRSPSFLRTAAKRIFNTGKSILFLTELGLRGATTGSMGHEPRLDHATVCGISDEVPLSPFPELFHAAFSNWMQSKYSQASVVLRQHLMSSGGLVRTLTILETLYLGKDGAVFEDFANALFERTDAGRRGWNDRYALTELTRRIFGTAMSLSEVERVVVRLSKPKPEYQTLRKLSTIAVDYAISWSIQNVVQRSAIRIYQQISTFLLQSYRVKYLLQRTRPLRTSHGRDPITLLKHQLRHRLTWFADTLRSYLTETAIFFTTQDMNEFMETAEDIDEMSQVHANYVAKLQERCLLSEDLKPIRKAILEVLELGGHFTSAVSSTEGSKTLNESTQRASEARRKNTTLAPDIAETLDSDTDTDTDQGEVGSPHSLEASVQQIPPAALRKIDSDSARLLHFITAGLRSVGRVGAEPMWEQLAERLEWEGKRDKT